LPSIKEGLHLCNDKQGTKERLMRFISPVIKEQGLNFDFSMMFSGYGIPDLAQVNVMTDLAKI
jgi:hypothetical protein